MLAKEDRHKRLYTVWFHLSNVQNKDKVKSDSDRNQKNNYHGRSGKVHGMRWDSS